MSARHNMTTILKDRQKSLNFLYESDEGAYELLRWVDEGEFENTKKLPVSHSPQIFWHLLCFVILHVLKSIGEILLVY